MRRISRCEVSISVTFPLSYDCSTNAAEPADYLMCAVGEVVNQSRDGGGVGLTTKGFLDVLRDSLAA